MVLFTAGKLFYCCEDKKDIYTIVFSRKLITQECVARKKILNCRQKSVPITISIVADPTSFDSDPNPTVYFDSEPVSVTLKMWIRIHIKCLRPAAVY